MTLSNKITRNRWSSDAPPGPVHHECGGPFGAWQASTEPPLLQQRSGCGRSLVAASAARRVGRLRRGKGSRMTCLGDAVSMLSTTLRNAPNRIRFGLDALPDESGTQAPGAKAEPESQIPNCSLVLASRLATQGCHGQTFNTS